MRELLGLRPNRNPTGVGHSQSDLDMDVVLEGEGAADPGPNVDGEMVEIDEEDDGVVGDDGDVKDHDDEEDDEDEDELAPSGTGSVIDIDDSDGESDLPSSISAIISQTSLTPTASKSAAPEPKTPVKRPAPTDATPATSRRKRVKTSPKPTTATTPTELAPKADNKTDEKKDDKKPSGGRGRKNKMVEFTELAMAEEATQKSAFEVAKSKVERDRDVIKSRTDREIARDAARAAYKTEKMKVKSQLKQQSRLERQRQDHEYRMARLHRQTPNAEAGSSHGTTRTSTPNSAAGMNMPDVGFNMNFGSAQDYLAAGNIEDYGGGLGNWDDQMGH